MHTHGPKRIYSPQSLEWWFERLSADWEGFFPEAVLELGREVYRASEIREIELGAADAIIHRRVEKKEDYTVIEWAEGRPSVRSSSTDETVAQAIAVAGLYEIEELIAEEIPALPASTPAAKAPAEKPATSAAAAAKSSGKNGAAAVASEPAAATPTKTKAAGADAAREFVLHFRPVEKGLACEAYWVEAGGQRVPAFGAGSANTLQLSSADRTKAIGLATYARKAHFHFHPESHAYVLELVREIPDFLRNVLPQWRKHFTVEVDPTVKDLQDGPRGIEIEAQAVRSRSSAGIDLRWVFRAGERLLTAAEVEEVTRHVGEQVLLPGVGIVALAAEKWEGVQSWKRMTADLHGDTIPPYLVFSLFNEARWKVTLTTELEQWKQRVLGQGALPEAKLPEFLRQYQRRGVEWMHHLCETDCHGLLADEMGLGKTVQVLSLLASRVLPKLRHIVVCPASVVPVWREEAARFFPQLKVEILKSGHDFVAHREPALWLASYAQLRKHRELLAGVEFGYAILDEGQFIKNPDAKVTHACDAIRARHRFVLSGTPLENRQLDLWSVFRFLLPGLLGTRTGFEAALQRDRDGTTERLRVQIAPFVLRRTKDEVAKELPAKVVMDLRCPLTDAQRLEYAKICDEGLRRLGSDLGSAMREKSFGLFALLTRLRQACCDPDLLPWVKAGTEESGKLNMLVAKLAEVLAGGHKVVIFSQFVMFLDRVREVLAAQFPDVARYELTGGTIDRQKPVQQFQNAPGRAIMLVSLKAAGTGITLHAADYVFLLDPWWNPAVEDQAIDRVHRLGQTNPVFVYRLMTAGTIEERIQALKAEKKAMFDQIVGKFRTEFDLSQHFASLDSLIKLAAAPETESEAELGEG
ncbi:MAG TPA: DEAD/DEAH box helicase [Opitutaceae bacterium]|nr:DEAD/DEAH box helicase [Opitutaceae bacterium]